MQLASRGPSVGGVPAHPEGGNGVVESLKEELVEKHLQLDRMQNALMFVFVFCSTNKMGTSCKLLSQYIVPGYFNMRQYSRGFLQKHGARTLFRLTSNSFLGGNGQHFGEILARASSMQSREYGEYSQVSTNADRLLFFSHSFPSPSSFSCLACG